MTNARREPAGARARLRLLATTDLHMNLTSHDYYTDRPDPSVGLTRTATLIQQARAEAEEEGALVLLFDNGDGLQGTPLSETAAQQPDRQHPLMKAFAHLRYDAIGLGNHDFNFGLKPLDIALRQAPCPVLSSNLRRLCNGKPAGFEPFTILDRMIRCGDQERPIRIGVLSFLPPQTVKWDSHLLEGQVEVDAIVDTARRWLPELRAAGCDLVIALAHSGLSSAPDQPDLENAALHLAGLDEIDAVISGHTHLHLPGPDHAGLDHVDAETGTVHGKPVVMPGTAGSHLGVIDLDLKATNDHRWMKSGFSCSLRPILRRAKLGKVETTTKEDPVLAELLSEDHIQTRTLMEQPVGNSTVSLHSYFSFFAPDRSLALVASAQAAALRPLLIGSEAEHLPVLSVTAPSKFGGRAGPGNYTDVPAGQLSQRHIADLHVFPNSLCAAVLTGEQLLEWLEMSASQFYQITPANTGSALVNPDMPGHDFDVIHGLTYEFDISLPARFYPDGTLKSPGNRRTKCAAFNDQPVRPRDLFVVAMNSYRASGGGPVVALEGAKSLQLPQMPLRDIICDYIAGRLEKDELEQAPPPWHFTPQPDCKAIVLTGPGATAHLEELHGIGVEVGGMTEGGFLQLVVPL